MEVDSSLSKESNSLLTQIVGTQILNCHRERPNTFSQTALYHIMSSSKVNIFRKCKTYALSGQRIVTIFRKCEKYALSGQRIVNIFTLVPLFCHNLPITESVSNC